MLAAGTAMFVAAAVALPATAPAFAAPGASFDAVGNKTNADVGDPNVFFRVDLANLPSACIETPPVVAYTLSVTSPNGTVPDASGTMDVYTDTDLENGFYEVWLPVENFSAGEVYTLNASTTDSCFGGETFNDSASITINGGTPPEEPGDGGDEPWEYTGDDTLNGVVWVQTVPNSSSPSDYVLGSGVDVAIVGVEGGTPIDTAVADSQGRFDLTVPVEEEGDEEIPYVVVAIVDDEFYGFTYDADAANPSATQPEDADWVYPYDFSEYSFDIYAGTVPEATWSISPPSFTVGVPFDQTFTAPVDGLWDWSDGGGIEVDGLPEGLDWEVVDEWEENTPPGLRIFGTPTEAGAYSFSVELEDCHSDGHVDFDVTGTVASSAPTVWSFPAPTFTVGVPFDRTFTAPVDGAWDWSDGGGIEVEGLPAGLDWEVVDEWESDTPPGLRIFGTPTEAGAYSFSVELEDCHSGGYTDFDVTGTVGSFASTDPEEQRDLELDLDLEVGEIVAGAQAVATASGLEEGEAFDIVVRSTPQTLAVGTVPAGGTVTRTVTLPTLEAGWHSLTFTSTWAGGGAAVSRVWFQVGADGTLLRVSSSAPALANTGVDDPMSNLWIGATALLAGIGLVTLRRRRSATA
ncbi:LPXTG cell wall anchor domain-containing protein [Pseudolysinimonas sp.]